MEHSFDNNQGTVAHQSIRNRTPNLEGAASVPNLAHKEPDTGDQYHPHNHRSKEAPRFPGDNKDRDGNRQEQTEWHNIVCWGRQAEIAGQYLTKGRQIYIEGRLQTRLRPLPVTGQHAAVQFVDDTGATVLSYGAATAIEFADGGWSVMAAGRDARRLDEVAVASDNISTWEGDLDSSDACEELVADTVDVGRLAGAHHRQPHQV